MLTERLRGVAERDVPGALGAAPVLAEVWALPLPVGELPGPVHVVRLDDKGRFFLAGVAGRLDWEPGDLRVLSGYDGWVVLGAAGPPSRCRATPRLSAAGRVTLPHALRRSLRVEPGDQALVLEVPRAGVLAVTNPAHILAAVPLDLAGVAERVGPGVAADERESR